jgi:molybdopterin/thiamine biosynthesis adenylyltransferase
MSLFLDKGLELRATFDGVPCLVQQYDEDDFNSRNSGLLSAEKCSGKKLAVVGAGSVGSRIVTYLAPLPLRMSIWDYDELAIENFVRWGLPVEYSRYIGRKKVLVLRELLTRAFPNTDITTHPLDIVRNHRVFGDHIGREKLDLVVCTTDTEESRRMVNAMSWAYRVPSIYVGLSDEAASGQLIVVDPKRNTPCYQCFSDLVEFDNIILDHSRQYGTPAGVPALALDIAIFSSIAAKVALAILTEGSEQGFKYLGTSEDNTRQATVMWFSQRPETWLMCQAFQKVGASITKNPNCAVCTRNESRIE